MNDTTKPGVISGEPINVSSEEFDDRFQAWLASALGFKPENVIANVHGEALSFDTREPLAFFEFISFNHNGAPYIVEETAEYALTAYEGTTECRVTIVSENARERALFLYDLIFFSQNVHALEALGLSITDANVTNLTQLREGNRATLSATVNLSLSYRYERKWLIRSLVAADSKIFFNR